MNNKTFPIILGSAILLAACKPTSGPITGTTEQKAQKLGEIIASGGTAACTITNLSDKSTVNLTVSGKKMKIVGGVMQQGKKGSMMNDTVYTYVWEEGQTTGFKFKNPTTEETSQGQATTPQQVDTSKTATVYEDETKYQVDCKQGVVNDSEFTPPAEVKFLDQAEMMKLSPEELQKLYQAK